MAWWDIGAAAVSVIGGVLSSNSASGAAKDAAKSQNKQSQLGIEEQQREFDQVRQLLSPYVGAGTQSLASQLDLIGLNGSDNQKAAIDKLSVSPEFTSSVKQGENAILANASATGGLRGGNTEAALAEFRPQLLSQLINKQFDRLSGLSAQGQNAAAGVGTAAQHTGDNVTNLLGQIGANNAGSILAQSQAQQQLYSDTTGAITQLLTQHKF